MAEPDRLQDALESWLSSLTDAGTGYGSALDLLCLLPALKLDDEHAGPLRNGPHAAPDGAHWSDLRGRPGQRVWTAFICCRNLTGTGSN